MPQAWSCEGRTAVRAHQGRARRRKAAAPSGQSEIAAATVNKRRKRRRPDQSAARAQVVEPQAVRRSGPAEPIAIGWAGVTGHPARILSAAHREANGILLVVLGRSRDDRAALLVGVGRAGVGVAIFLSGIVELADAWYSDSSRTHYSSGIFSVLAGALVSLQSAFAFSGLMVGDQPGAARRRRHQRPACARRRAQRRRQPAVGLHQRRRQHWPRGDRVVAARHDRRARLRILPRRPHGGVRVADAGGSRTPVDGDEFARPEDEHPNRALGLPAASHHRVHPSRGRRARGIADAERISTGA